MPNANQPEYAYLRNIIDQKKSPRKKDIIKKDKLFSPGDIINEFIQTFSTSPIESVKTTAEIDEHLPQNFDRSVMNAEDSKLSYQLMFVLRKKILTF